MMKTDIHEDDRSETKTLNERLRSRTKYEVIRDTAKALRIRDVILILIAIHSIVVPPKEGLFGTLCRNLGRMIVLSIENFNPFLLINECGKAIQVLWKISFEVASETVVSEIYDKSSAGIMVFSWFLSAVLFEFIGRLIGILSMVVFACYLIRHIARR